MLYFSVTNFHSWALSYQYLSFEQLKSTVVHQGATWHILKECYLVFYVPKSYIQHQCISQGRTPKRIHLLKKNLLFLHWKSILLNLALYICLNNVLNPSWSLLEILHHRGLQILAMVGDVVKSKLWSTKLKQPFIHYYLPFRTRVKFYF